MSFASQESSEQKVSLYPCGRVLREYQNIMEYNDIVDNGKINL